MKETIKFYDSYFCGFYNTILENLFLEEDEEDKRDFKSDKEIKEIENKILKITTNNLQELLNQNNVKATVLSAGYDKPKYYNYRNDEIFYMIEIEGYVRENTEKFLDGRFIYPEETEDILKQFNITEPGKDEYNEEIYYDID